MPFIPVNISDGKYTITLGKLVEYLDRKGKTLWDAWTWNVPTIPNEEKADTAERIQNAFIEFYRFHEVAAETPERFIQRLKSIWTLRMEKYSPMMTEAAKPLEVNRTSKGVSKSRSIGEATPDNKIDLDINNFEKFPYASSANTGAVYQEGYSGWTESELRQSFYDVQRELLKEFLDSLDDLFLQIY